MDQLKGVWHLTDRTCDIIEVAVDTLGFTFQRIPVHRSLGFLCSCLLQLVIASGLLVAGVQLLSTTTDILNGVALACIMEIDELTYHVLVPAKVRTMITMMNPLKTVWTMNVPVRPLVLSVPLIVILVTSTLISTNHARHVEEAATALCAELQL